MERIKSYKIKDLLLVSLFSLLIGLAAGLVTSIFGQGILFVTSIRQNQAPWLLFLLPLAGLIIRYAYREWGGHAGKGMGLVFEVGQKKRKKIPKRLLPFAILATWVSHLFGASVGREGVAVQLGAGLGNIIHRYFKLPFSSRTYLIIGMAAGFAGLFQTPWAASIFALEILIVGRIEWKALVPSLLAAQTASITSKVTGLESFQLHLANLLDWSPLTLVKYLLLGLFFALVGNLFAYLLKASKAYLQGWMGESVFRYLILATILTACLYLLWDGRYTGLGSNLILAALKDQPLYAYDWLFKLLLTSFSLAIGFQGGEVTPVFAMGAAAGAFMGAVLGLPVTLAAALGYVAVFGAATNTSWAAFIMSFELFGYHNWPLFLLVVILASRILPQQSIYGQQEFERKAFFSLQ